MKFFPEIQKITLDTIAHKWKLVIIFQNVLIFRQEYRIFEWLYEEFVIVTLQTKQKW